MTDNTDIASFFKDPSASSAISLRAQQIAAPVVSGLAITVDELSSGGGIRVVYLVIDRSPSMEPVARLLLEGFNKYYVPAVQAAQADDIATLRIGGLTFSSDITPIWIHGGNALHSLDTLPPLTTAEYDPSRGHSTALNQAIIDGTATAIRYAADERSNTGIQPEVDIITLSDGANNCAPMDSAPVRKIIKGSKADLVRHTFLYFETNWGSDDPATIAADLGYDGENVMIFAKKPGETDKEYASRFRRMMRVMSRVSASRGNSAIKASAAVAATPDDLL